MQNTPPKKAINFLRWFCREDYLDEIEGDLIEIFEMRFQENPSKANRFFWWQVILHFRPDYMKSFKTNPLIRGVMLQNYLKIGWRNQIRNKGYSFINISGLAIGISLAILVGIWINDEVSFNKYHDNYDNIAQVLRSQARSNGEKFISTYQPTALGALLKDRYDAQFKHVVMVRRTEEHMLTFNTNSFVEKGNFMQADAPEMLSLEIVEGAKDGLKDLNSIMLSESLAIKIFGNSNPINKEISIDGNESIKVTSIYKDIPINSAFHEAAYIAPLELYFKAYGAEPITWSNFNMQVYVQKKQDVDFQEISTLIKDELADNKEIDDAELKPALFLNPMSKWHLYSEFKNGEKVTSTELKFIYLYSTICSFILLLACINFVNLSTAQSEKRAKEIGIRKSIGSLRAQLISQFLVESIIVALAALLLSFAIVYFILPWFNGLAGKEMEFPISNPWFWGISFGFSIITGLMAGSYPALFLSGFNPIKSLKGAFSTGKSATIPRKVLVVFQFTVSITLIISTLIINQQVQFAKNRPLGYEKEGLIMIPKRVDELYGKYDIFREELKSTGVVEEIAEASYPLTTTNGQNSGFDWQGKDADFNPIFNTVSINHEYGDVVRWELKEGRSFSRDLKTDALNVVITESAQKLMGLANPIGKILKSSDEYNGSNEFTIIGVVKDMVKEDPFQETMPAIMFLREKNLPWMFVKLSSVDNMSTALEKIEAVFKKVAPSAPFDYKFMDEAFDTKFKAEIRLGKLATFFTIIAIFISCLGLFGLIAYIAEKKTKEIGIRKVLGASVFQMWQLLSKDFIVLIILSCAIAIPVSYYFMSKWLLQYEYRTGISWDIFLMAVLGGMLITLLTISFKAIKAAVANPTQSLRSE